MTIAQKRNVKPHLKSKRHLANCKAQIAVPDEEAAGSGNLNELGFVRETPDKTARPGTHFLLEFNRPVKYKIARRLVRTVAACKVCLIRFRNQGILRRHKEGKQHKEMVRVKVAKKRLMNKKVAGGDVTHGQIIAKIYERFPSLKFKSRLQILRRKLIKEQEFIDKAVICNEFGGDLFKNSHCHMYLQTNQKYTFKQMKKLIKKKFHQKVDDIRRPINFRECIRFVTKEDRASVVVNIPLKFTSTVFRAARYFLETSSPIANYGDYIPSTVAASDRKVFESVLSGEGRLSEAVAMSDRVKSVNLLPWQQELMTEIRNVQDSNRKVLWIVDIAGGAGKSVLCQWLMSYSQGFGSSILFQDFDYRNNSYLYAKERMVLFDLPRSSKPDNLKLIEDLKNGYIISTKYEVRKKVFASPLDFLCLLKKTGYMMSEPLIWEV